MIQPYLILLFTYISAILSQHIGTSILQKTQTPLMHGMIWITLPLFLLATIACKKWDFKKIFLYSSVGVGFSLLLSILFFDQSPLGFWICSGICTQILPVLGWGFINQMATRSDGEKNYFLLHFLIGLSMTPLSFLPSLAHKHSSFYLWSLLGGAIGSMILANVCLKKSELPQPEKETSSLKLGPTVALLGLLASSFRLLNIFYAPVANLKLNTYLQAHPEIASSAAAYGTLISQYEKWIGAGTILLSFLSLWLGPLVLRKRNWSFAILSAIFIGIGSLLLTPFSSHPYFLGSQIALMGALHYFWIFPLIQIAFLKFDLKDRFFLQAAVFLVVVPSIENSSSFISLSPLQTQVLSLILLVSMAYLFKNERRVLA